MNINIVTITSSFFFLVFQSVLYLLRSVNFSLYHLSAQIELTASSSLRNKTGIINNTSSTQCQCIKAWERRWVVKPTKRGRRQIVTVPVELRGLCSQLHPANKGERCQDRCHHLKKCVLALVFHKVRTCSTSCTVCFNHCDGSLCFLVERTELMELCRFGTSRMAVSKW